MPLRSSEGEKRGGRGLGSSTECERCRRSAARLGFEGGGVLAGSADGRYGRALGPVGRMLEPFEVSVDHHRDELREGRAGLPTEASPGEGGVGDQVVDLGRAEEGRVEADVPLGIEARVAERRFDEVAHRVRLAGGDHVVVRLGLLEHQPHRLDVVLGVAPVTLCVEVAEGQLALKAELDGGRGMGDLARDELQTTTL